MVLTSPTSGASVGRRFPIRVGSISTWTTFTLPGAGRCFVYGKLVPTMSSVSISSIRSAVGPVPRSPMPPVVYGEPSGSTIFPDSVLITGAARVSASRSSSEPAPRAPIPARIAAFFAWFRIDAAASSSGSLGRTLGCHRIGAVLGGFAGATDGHGLSPASAI